MIYRHGGTSAPTPAATGRRRRSAWLARDPIPAQRARLEAAGAQASVIDQLEADANAVAVAEEAARAAPDPDPASATTVWADGGSEWRK